MIDTSIVFSSFNKSSGWAGEGPLRCENLHCTETAQLKLILSSFTHPQVVPKCSTENKLDILKSQYVTYQTVVGPH